MSNSSDLDIFDADSVNIACSLAGLPTSALTERNGMEALMLMARIPLCLSSGVICPGVFRSADGSLLRTHEDNLQSYYIFFVLTMFFAVKIKSIVIIIPFNFKG